MLNHTDYNHICWLYLWRFADNSVFYYLCRNKLVMRTRKDIIIGTRYQTRGKVKRVCEVIDIYKTYNNAGELVKVSYVSMHEFAGQVLKEYDVVSTTILMGWIE